MITARVTVSEHEDFVWSLICKKIPFMFGIRMESNALCRAAQTDTIALFDIIIEIQACVIAERKWPVVIRSRSNSPETARTSQRKV
jgi:hypothetical protein